MGMDKQSSKSGGYVGGFFQLFDWKAKSRKKLFSSKSESPEHSKQEKRSEENLPMTRLYLKGHDEAGMDYACHSNGGFSCASSVTDDDGSGIRGPSVVARLMGLDSLTMSISSSPYLTTFSDTQFLRDSHGYHRNLDYPHNDHVMYPRNFSSRMEGPVRHTVEERPQIQRTMGRPIEKFQSEVLPPKSAKSIPITQHRLLSPIKSPGFIPSRDAAHIMEAAAKIIDPGQHPIAKGKMPILLPSSGIGRIRDGKYKEEQPSHVLLRVQDIKEKIDAAHRTSRLAEASERSLGANTSKCLEGHSLNKSWSGLEASLFRASSDKEEAYSSSRSKGKSISLAVQAKANVQKRGGMSLSERSSVSQMETSESKLGESLRGQSRASKNQLKRLPVSNSSGALRQNNQKQNCTIDKEKPPSEPSFHNLQARKALSDDSPARTKTSNRSVGGSRVGSRRLEAMGIEKESTSSSTRHIQRKKRSIEGELQFNKIHVRDDTSGDKSKKPVQSISKLNKLSTWAEDSRKNGSDVVSFTFTAPLARTMPAYGTSGHLTQKSSNCLGKRAFSQTDNMRWPESNTVLGGDALGRLLEQKLQELSNEVGTSCHDSLSGQSSSSSTSPFLDTMSTHTATNTMQKSQDSSISWPSGCGFGSEFNSDCFTTNVVPFKFSNEIQGFDEERYDNKAKELDFHHPSPSSVLEPPFSAESCFSSESIDSNSMEGNSKSLAPPNEIVGLRLQQKPHSLEADVDLSDSASSLLTRGAITRKQHTPTMIANTLNENTWEVYYVKDILSNIELMFKDFMLGRAPEIISPHLFEQLEGRKDITKTDSAVSRLTRKVLFDCVGECMYLRCKNFVGGGFGSWTKGFSMVRRKERLAEDVYEEIMDWISLGDSMVDELVDKDMRNPYGRWVDFDTDVFELGLEIERDILDSLVDEVIAPLLK